MYLKPQLVCVLWQCLFSPTYFLTCFWILIFSAFNINKGQSSEWVLHLGPSVLSYNRTKSSVGLTPPKKKENISNCLILNVYTYIYVHWKSIAIVCPHPQHGGQLGCRLLFELVVAQVCKVGTDTSTLITSQRANFPVMEETPTQLGPDGCQDTNNAGPQTHTQTITFHMCRTRYIQICIQIYSWLDLSNVKWTNLRDGISGTCDEEKESGT